MKDILSFKDLEYKKIEQGPDTEKERKAAMKVIMEEKKNFWNSPELVEFNRRVRDKGLKRGRSGEGLGSVDAVEKDIREYFDLCEEFVQIPSIKGLCIYLGITFKLYKEYLDDVDSEYCGIFRAAIDYIHTVIENGALNNRINPATYMFTAANFYDMDNSRQVKIDTTVNLKPSNRLTSEGIKALREELLKERGDTVKIGPAKDADFEEK